MLQRSGRASLREFARAEVLPLSPDESITLHVTDSLVSRPAALHCGAICTGFTGQCGAHKMGAPKLISRKMPTNAFSVSSADFS